MCTYSEYETLLENNDNQLATKYPLNKRVFANFRIIFPNEAEEFLTLPMRQISTQASSKYWLVYDWYLDKYCDAQYLIESLGYKPFLLNSKLYNLRIYFIYNTDRNKSEEEYKKAIIDMPDKEKNNLSQSAMKIVRDEHLKGYIFLSKLNILEDEMEKIQKNILNLLATGIFDINLCSSAFISHLYLDAQPIMFHAQQAAEKFLKALMVYLLPSEYLNKTDQEIDDAMKKYSHKLLEIKKQLDCLINNNNYTNIKPKIDYLYEEVPMKIRYIDSGKTIQDAIKCIEAMNEICIFVIDELTKFQQT